jgi:hypothetical protein
MNSSGWDRFRKQQAAEREQLQRLLVGVHELLTKCRDAAPTEIELSALAATLHSFYTGVENIFKRVAVELDGQPAVNLMPNWGQSWGMGRAQSSTRAKQACRMSSWRVLTNRAGARAMRTTLSATAMALRKNSRNREKGGLPTAQS